MTFLSVLQPFVVSLLIGLAVGIERERSVVRTGGVMGVRSFAILAILGTAVATLDDPMVTATLGVLVSAMIVAGYWRTTAKDQDPGDRGQTTELAAALVFVLGMLAKDERFLAGVLGVLLAVVLYYRTLLHRFAKDVLKPYEITSALLLAAFVVIIVPLVPDDWIDPWRLFNPRRLAQMVALIGGIEFLGYAAQRLLGATRGTIVTGFLAGLASSTAAFVTIGKAARGSDRISPALVSAAMVATAAALLLCLTIIGAASEGLIASVGPPVGGAMLAALGIGFAAAKYAPNADVGAITQQNPMDPLGVLRLAGLIFVMITIATIAREYLGAAGANAVSLIGGLFELHGITLANATVHASGAASTQASADGILLAVVGSQISKVGICWLLSPGRFAATITACQILVTAIGAFVFYLVR